MRRIRIMPLAMQEQIRRKKIKRHRAAMLQDKSKSESGIIRFRFCSYREWRDFLLRGHIKCVMLERKKKRMGSMRI